MHRGNEPPKSEALGAQLSDVDQNATMVNRVSKLGLQLGWIFTHAPREELLTCAEIQGMH